MDSRRKFLGTVASGIATTIAAPSTVLGANGRVRMGIIGPGDRGMQLVREAIKLPAVEFAAFADIYTKRLADAKQLVPNAKTYLNYQDLLDDKTIDAVLIATPQHLHAECFVAALAAGKHVYQEKTMAFSVEHAKRMRAAYKRVNKVVQIGHQSTSSALMTDAVNLVQQPELMGKVTAIHMHMYRNTPHGKPQWSRPVYPDMNQENIIWSRFLGEAPKREFDANRYINWRFFWDYSGGNVYENMCHQLAFWYKAVGLQIPKSATMTGGVYLWKDGREVPDTMNVSLEQPEEMLITWDSGFGNSHLGVSEEVLGTDGTVSKGQQIRYTPQKVNRPSASEIVGQTRAQKNETAAHIENFVDAIRSGATLNCPFELGYNVSIACRMTVESYRQHRTIKWDPVKEELV